VASSISRDGVISAASLRAPSLRCRRIKLVTTCEWWVFAPQTKLVIIYDIVYKCLRLSFERPCGPLSGRSRSGEERSYICRTRSLRRLNVAIEE
jgi:hypothetical protein